MQDCCEQYSVPYALALAMAEVESHFDPDAVSSTGDYGLMQINTINHAWLLEKGIDVQTYEGNIEAGIYIISGYLQTYEDTEKALMAYNCGPTGARRLWEAGTYQTNYTRKVMAAYEYWTNLLEG
jgi:soluble lytic murein transglycosylase-like protein